MHPRIISAAALSAAAGFLLSGCAGPGDEPGMFSDVDGSGAGNISRMAGMGSAESFATGGSSGAIISATTFIVAKHKATERQRRIAEQRARATFAKMRVERTKPRAAAQPAKKRRAKAPAKKVPRYIAVDTVKDERTSPQAKKSVMIWDTRSEQVVGNAVYDVQTPPPVGSTARFETYSAEYVGAGT